MHIVVYAIEVGDVRLPGDDEVCLVRVHIYKRERPGNLRLIKPPVNIFVIADSYGLEVVPVEHPYFVLSEEEMLLPVAAKQAL